MSIKQLDITMIHGKFACRRPIFVVVSMIQSNIKNASTKRFQTEPVQGANEQVPFRHGEMSFHVSEQQSNVDITEEMSRFFSENKLKFEAVVLDKVDFLSFTFTFIFVGVEKLLGSCDYPLTKARGLIEQPSFQDNITLFGTIANKGTTRRKEKYMPTKLMFWLYHFLSKVPVGKCLVNLKVVEKIYSNEQNGWENTIDWPGITHVRKWSSAKISGWPESHIHIAHSVVGEAVTKPQRGQWLDFNETLELPFRMLEEDDTESLLHPIILECVNESTRKAMDRIRLPVQSLSLLGQHYLSITSDSKVQSVIECLLWFEPHRRSLLNILNFNPNMAMLEVFFFF
ncbi:hypothetical protein RFI_10931 [Reticulomyxa filosa]|uniref:Uncharacterized protein n=1 Tax=Reticulomyxa filosa TaxID=46433 RepID=X6NLE9_RETFI|nr:hypothetical protein RFI_10931 [Reticulomyxa filosa]|eukprot:ETO26207.1 hypothetical protein RFI_10931 [Reticulomyxa filosa]